jgi:predicted Fe-Mo cluster-binding NifX family protein
MRIAIPVAAGKLAMHFGHCETFAFLDVDPKTKKVIGRTDQTPPAHAPGVLPKWLSDEGATLVIAGGMGSRAQGLFSQNGIEVIVGVASAVPEELAQAYLAGTLAAGENVCDH